MSHITTLAFDADDTLWQNERFFQITQARFQALLADYADPDHLAERLLAAERRNLDYYGYGVKGFTLSMVETALEVTEDSVPGTVLRDIVEAGRALHAHPVELLPGAAEVVRALTEDYRILLITKGDLFDQERKLAQSGLGDHFDAVEIVSEKTPETYARIFGAEAETAMMVGNSLKSDVLPALAAGAWGCHVPHGLTWALDHADPPEDAPRFLTIETLKDLPALLARLG
ncbi:HAD family hydrolase [Oceanibium sediminis]|uniref:HAD family hydrolase n=1 Tax=Oceanibium sediminis TaxID=2026339 RepID=UPI000DD33B31|nr:HAD family hydrolase [Oceanibium sediminis]